MNYKQVYFGRVLTKQLQCPKCLEWQFESSKCSECYYDFKLEKLNKKPNEYRSEMPTWRDNIRESIRRNVYTRDEFTCQYCGYWCYEDWILDNRKLTIDHIIPFTGGGTTTEDNLVTCCKECNCLKSNKHFKSFEEAREYILKRKKDHEGL